MIKRRDFNKYAAIAATLPLAAKFVSRAQARQSSAVDMDTYFIYEEGIDSTEEALFSLDHYKKVYPIKGDVTQVWYRELHYLWKDRHVITAGITRESELFILETLARGYNYKVLFRKPQIQKPLVSWLIAPAEMNFIQAVQPSFG